MHTLGVQKSLVSCLCVNFDIGCKIFKLKQINIEAFCFQKSKFHFTAKY